MKLNSTQVKQTLSQFQAEVLPDDHPAVAQLNNLFGEHTFFLDGGGLKVLEPAGAPDTTEARIGELVSLAELSEVIQAAVQVTSIERDEASRHASLRADLGAGFQGFESWMSIIPGLLKTQRGSRYVWSPLASLVVASRWTFQPTDVSLA